MTMHILPDIAGQYTIIRDIDMDDPRESIFAGIVYFRNMPFPHEEMNDLIVASLSDEKKLPKLTYKGLGLYFREEGQIVSLCHRDGDHISEPFAKIEFTHIDHLDTAQIMRILDHIDVKKPKKSLKPSLSAPQNL